MRFSSVVFFALAAILPFRTSLGGVLTNGSIIVQPPDFPISTEDVFPISGQPHQPPDEYGLRMQQIRPVKATVAALLTSFAEAFSILTAAPIIAAISFVNRVANVTNHTLHVGGELTKLPLAITNTIIDELSNITFPN